MERGAGGGAGERTLEQAFEQCVSGVARSNRMFERRVSGGRALEQAFKQRVIRGERERERERVRAGQTQATEQRMHA